MNKEELKSYDGKDGRPAYVAYKGKVYDVTDSKMWKEGLHVGRHNAGEDLSDLISVAPHDEEVFERVKEVGFLEEEEKKSSAKRKETYRNLYRKYHPHPIMIHFPIGTFFFSALMQLLFLVTGNNSFEYAAFYGLCFATANLIPAMASGVFSWWVNYEMTVTNIFKNKLTFSVILLISALIVVTIRFLVPDVSYRAEFLSYIYYSLIFLNVPFTVTVAYFGGKITWPS